MASNVITINKYIYISFLYAPLLRVMPVCLQLFVHLQWSTNPDDDPSVRGQVSQQKLGDGL